MYSAATMPKAAAKRKQGVPAETSKEYFELVRRLAEIVAITCSYKKCNVDGLVSETAHWVTLEVNNVIDEHREQQRRVKRGGDGAKVQDVEIVASNASNNSNDSNDNKDNNDNDNNTNAA